MAKKAARKPDAATALRAREKLILGKPPRMPPLTSDEALDAAMKLGAKLRKAALPDAAPIANIADMPEIMQTLMCHPDLWERVSLLSIQLLANGALPRRDTELAILRTGWLWQAPYEWGEHVVQAKKSGLTSKDIERITVGSSARGWSAKDRAVLRAVEELQADAMVTERTWAALAKHYDHKQLFELLILVGQFTTVSYFQNTLRLRLGPGNSGLRAR